MMNGNLWSQTPLIRSSFISQTLGCDTYLKLETVHPSYSFKYRGISHFVRTAKEKHGPSVHVFIASGGNAGTAAAVAARNLDVRCTVFLPFGASERIIAFIKDQRAEVRIHGKIYAEALQASEEAARSEEHGVMIPAYDDATVWEGHSSMVKEIQEQLGEDVKPSAIFCSVGGAGLLGGILIGMEAVGWEDVPVVALETIGSNCFHHSMDANQAAKLELPGYTRIVEDPETNLKLAHFDEFHSIASGSLGASQPAARVVRMALDRKGVVSCVSVPDSLAMKAALCFVEDHKILVEPSCSTALCPAYSQSLFNKVVPGTEGPSRKVVFIVCGGFKVTFEDLVRWKKVVTEDMMGRDIECIIGQDRVSIPL
ncbi:tryptophan synthase beta subunit-like PLP-dependent enzyme [Flagelloscypha sp. PMI_526]|nr:tryptophan synthase beta subunit-like PLP-dependent enzyme [Flagelloscypha sp. PMI_526]